MKTYLLQLIAAMILVLGVSSGLALAQTQPPTADDALLLQQIQGKREVQGRVSIPDEKSGVLIQPQGRDWRGLREGPMKTVGGGLLIVTVIGLCLFFAVRGRIKIAAGPSGRRIVRFGMLERFTHWLTAVSFVVLGLTGLNLVFGRKLLLPLIGADAFAMLTQIGKLAHNYLSFPFVLGVVLMVVLWARDNIPNATDLTWFKQGGGLLKNGAHPPAGKFNAGQKLVFWSVVLVGGAVAVSGYILMFPFSLTDINGMQITHLVHALLALLMIAVIIAHIYIGTVGMEGAFDAMGSGEVDLNWAKEHHSLWVQRENSKAGSSAAE